LPSLFNRNQANSSTPPAGSNTANPPGSAPPAVPTLPLSPELENAAGAFKKLFIDNNAKYHLEGGQGAVYREMRRLLVEKVWAMKTDSLKTELVSLLQGDGFTMMRAELFHSEVRLSLESINKLKKDDPGHPDTTKVPGVLQSNSIVNTTRTYRDTTARARSLMADPAVSAPDRQLATEILDDKSANGNWSWNTTASWMAVPKLAPVVFDKISLPRVLALAINASVQCAPIAASTAQKLYRTRGVAIASVPPFAAQTFCTKASEFKLRPQDVDDRSTDRNLILRYNPTQLDNAMQAARTLLAPATPSSGYLSAGCLSGFTWEATGKDRHPFPEHFILIFAAHNDCMLFWDPDASSTYITEFGNRLGINIGLLYYDHSNPARPTLSTGVDFADLSTLSGGDHDAHRRRHRYQISQLVRV
jgi:hypothetical protein